MYFKSSEISEPQSCKSTTSSSRNAQDLESRLKQYKDYAESTSQLNDALNVEVKTCYSRIENLTIENADLKEQVKCIMASIAEADRKINELNAENKAIKMELSRTVAGSSSASGQYLEASLSNRASPTGSPAGIRLKSPNSPEANLSETGTTTNSSQQQIMNLQALLDRERQQKSRLQKLLKHKQETLEATLFEVENTRRRQQSLRTQELQHLQLVEKELQKYKQLESHFGKQADIIRSYQASLSVKNDQINYLQTQLNEHLSNRVSQQEKNSAARSLIQVEALREHVESLNQHIQKLKLQIHETHKDNARLKTDVLVLESQVQAKQEEAEKYRKTAIDREAVIQQQLQQIKQLSQIEILRNQVLQQSLQRQKLEAQLTATVAALTQSQSQVATLRVQLESLRQSYNNEIGSLNQKMEQMDRLLVSQKKLLDQRNSQIANQQSQLFSAMSESQIQHNQQVERLKTENKKLIQDLNSKSALVQEFNSKMEAMMKELEQLQVQQERHRQVEDALRHTQEELAYIKQKMEDNKHLIGQMSQLQTECRNLKQALHFQDSITTELRQENQKLKDSVGSLTSEVERLASDSAKLSAAKAQLYTLKLEYSNSLKENNTLKENQARLQRKRSDTHTQIQKLQRQRAIEKQTFEELSKLKSQLQFQLLSSYQQIDALNKLIIAKEEENAAMKTRLDAAVRRQQLFNSGSPSIMRRDASCVDHRFRRGIPEEEQVPVRDRSTQQQQQQQQESWKRMQAKIQNLKSQNNTLKKGMLLPPQRKH